MLNKILTITLCFFICNNVYANKLIKATGVGVSGYIIYKNKDIISDYIFKKISSNKEAKKVAKKIAKKIIDEENNGLKYINYKIKEDLIKKAQINLDRYNLPLIVLEELNWINKQEKKVIKQDNKIFNDAVIYLTKRVDEKVKWEKFKDCSSSESSDAIFEENEYKEKEPKIFFVDVYANLENKKINEFKLENDHIPEYETVIEYIKNKKGRNLEKHETELIKKNLPAITIPEKLHKEGRTYGDKNSKLKYLDSKDLFVSFFQDYTVHFLNLEFKENRTYKTNGIFGKKEKTIKLSKAREELIESMSVHFIENDKLCLF